MKIGTRSILFGVHQFALHPFTVALAWNRLYGFPKDPRLWIAFFVHDLGYWGKSDMDGDEGETHPEFGAKAMKIFGHDWHDMCLYHSRYYAKRDEHIPSKLCAADKLSFGMTPWWLYIPLAMLSGEIYEYMDLAIRRQQDGEKYTEYTILPWGSKRMWYDTVKDYLDRWVEEHKSSDKPDTWTPSG